MMTATKLTIAAAIPAAIATGAVVGSYMAKGREEDQKSLPVIFGIAALGAAGMAAGHLIPMSNTAATAVHGLSRGVAAGALAGGFGVALGAILVGANGY